MLEAIGIVILFFLILSILVIIHECGHFFAARVCGVHVEEFGLGFPPRARAWIRNGIHYSLNWLPLGGFVKLKGEQGEGPSDTDSFASKSLFQRLFILVAGVGMNLLLAVALLTLGFSMGMPEVVDTPDAGTGTGASLSIQIVQVIKDSPAEKIGIALGDVIQSVNGQSFRSINDLQEFIRGHEGVPVIFRLERGGEMVVKEVAPTRIEGGQIAVGIGLAKIKVVSYPIHTAFIKAIQTTWIISVSIFSMLGTAVSRLAFDGFVGPVGIATYTATAVHLGFSYVINLMAQLSISLAVINVLPIPALDGGRVMFALVERVRGKALRPALENAIHLIGFVTLVVLLLAVTIRDIQRLIPS